MLPRNAAFLILAWSLPGVAIAQEKPIELGFDGSFEVDFNGSTATILSVPVGSVRAGFFVSDQFSVEPRLGFQFAKVEGSDAAYSLDLGLSGLYHFEADATRARPYVRGEGGISVFGGGGDSASQFKVVGGVGVKIPIVGQLGARLEAGFAHAFENDDFASRNGVGVLFGFSVFTR